MKKKGFRFFVLLLIVVLTHSCAGPKSMIINSVTVKRLEALPHKVFVLSYMESALPGSFKDGYVQSMTEEFNRLRSTVVAAQVTGLELDKDVYVRQMEDLQPDLVLILRSDLNTVWGGDYSGKIFLSLYDYRDNSEVWKSLQTFSFSYFNKRGLYNAGTKFAKDAFQKLLYDRVFMQEKPDKNSDKFALLH